MATIFQKTATDNCVVLQSQESLTYPFDLGNWSEIRLGVEMSIVSVTGGFNVVGANETVGGNSMTNSFYFGFKDTGSLFPNVNSGFFIGALPNAASQQYIVGGGGVLQAATSELKWGIQSGTTLKVSPPFNTASRTIYAAGAFSPDTTLYSSRQGLRVVLNNRGTVNQFLQLDTFNNDVTRYTPNISGLRTFINLMANSVSGTYQYLTNGFTGNNAALPFPNAFFIYNPFLNNQIRIHTLLVERYA